MPKNKFAKSLEQHLADFCNVCFAVPERGVFDMVTAFSPDLVLIDATYISDGGVGLCESLKSDLVTAHVLVVFLAADEKMQELFLLAGADCCFAKSASSGLLAVQLRNLLTTSQYGVSRLRAILAGKEPLSKKAAPSDVSLESLDNLVCKHIDNADLGVELLCRELDLTHWQLYRRIKELTGLTIREYVRNRRINASVYKVVEQKYSMSEIAYMVGFSNPSYFAHCFKRAFGCSPTDFASKQRGRGMIAADVKTINANGACPARPRELPVREIPGLAG